MECAGKTGVWLDGRLPGYRIKRKRDVGRRRKRILIHDGIRYPAAGRVVSRKRQWQRHTSRDRLKRGDWIECRRNHGERERLRHKVRRIVGACHIDYAG